MNLYIGNLSPRVDHTDLQAMVAGMGHILYAKYAESSSVGANCGYAYLYVPNEEQARHVMARLNGHELKGARLTVSPMTERLGVIGSGRRRQ